MISKERILSEIRRTAEENGGKALGKGRFLAETGIRGSDWSGRYWVRWSDALAEAGYEPNPLNAGFTDEHVLTCLARFVAEVGHFPVTAELVLQRRQDPTFPSEKTFRRFGNKADLAQRLATFASERGLDDVVAICTAHAPTAPARRSRVKDLLRVSALST